MMRRLRIAQVVIQPVLAWDDGEELTPGPAINPKPVSLSELDGLAAKLRVEVEALQAQLAADEPPPDDAP